MSAWYDNSVFYHMYPLGMTGAPRENHETETADRFLRNMVRAIVGTLVDVGRGKITVSDFSRIIDEKDRCSAGSSAPPQGLFLCGVTYPDSIYLDSIEQNKL